MVQQPPFVASSNSNPRSKRREDHNNNDIDHFTGRKIMVESPENVQLREIVLSKTRLQPKSFIA